MDEPKTTNDWRQLELEMGRLFSAAPFSPVGSLDHGPRQELYPGRAVEMHLMMHAVRDPAKHILLYGERSLGKTSLSNTFWRNLSTSGQPVLAARVQAYPFDNFSSLWSRALEEFHTVFRRYNQEICSNFAHVSPDIVRREFQKLPAHLGAIMIVDEFDLLRSREARELTANLLKSLHDHAINVTVLLIGVAENIEELIINHQSLRRVLTLVKLERMNIIDLHEILDSRLRLTPLRISDVARSEIVTLSCGLPYYVQTLGRFATQNAIKNQRVRVETEDVNAAIENFLEECGNSFTNDYHRATESRRENNIFQEVILACAITPSDSGGVFKPAEVIKNLKLIDPGKFHHHARVQQYLSQFILERRGKILIRSGIKADYRYRFSDALMQPFIVMRAIKDTMIDQSLRHLLLRSGKEEFRDPESRLGAAEPNAAQLGMIIPTVAEEAGGEEPIISVSRPAGSELGLYPGNTDLIRTVRDSSRTATAVRETQGRSWRLFRR
jgi:Cdc6-like AAA superfamily ATPase